MIDPGLKDKVVLITGGNNPRGIGAATAKAFAAQGAAVFIHYFRQGAPRVEADALAERQDYSDDWYRAAQTLSADSVVEAIRATGGRAEAWEADLGDATAVPQLFDRAEKAFAVAAPMPRGLFPPVMRTTLSFSPGSIMGFPHSRRPQQC